MGNFNDLFEELKTEKIETKTLGEIVEKFVTGEEKINKNRENDGNFPAIVCKDVFETRFYIDECKYFVDETTLKRLPVVEQGDILMANSGYSKSKKKSGTCLFAGDFKALAGKNIYILKHSQNPKYFSLALDTKSVEEQMESYFKEGLSSMMSIYLYDIKKLKVPVPGLDAQRKIGFFLFIFVEYEKFLKKELESRRRQFHFFKELIFKAGIEEKDWEFKTMEEIATEIYSGSDVTKVQLGTGDFPAIRIKEIYHSNLKIEKCINFVDPNLIKRKKYCEDGDILLADTSENLEDFGKACVYLGKDKCLVGNHIIVIKNQQNPKFLSFYLSSDIAQSQIKLLCQKSTIYQLYPKNLKKLEVPLPPLEEQERIVEILDKFYDLSENQEEGINRLIELNRKQYEYYRDLIFSIMKI